jgi:hypothetical protein
MHACRNRCRIFLASALAAADFWEEKDFTTWSSSRSKNVDRLTMGQEATIW